ncbi:MAG: FkbM family methyltransferase [Pseudomonadota bacterium]
MIKRVRRLAQRLGYDLSPLKKARDLDRQIVAALKANSIDLVVDVGANQGQYAQRLRRAGWAGPILSIEPLQDLNQHLSRRARSDAAWHIAPPLALGDRDGRARLMRSAESDMSSVLEQNALMQRVSPSSAIVGTVDVPLYRFETLELPVENDARLFLKLDVQGYEAAVLEGVGARWPSIHGLQLEMALVPVYQGEVLWREMVDRLAARGFEVTLVLPGYFEPKLARQLQCDGVFFRNPASAS